MEKNINKQELENIEQEIKENELESVSGGERMSDAPDRHKTYIPSIIEL